MERFKELLNQLVVQAEPQPMAIACAADLHTLQATAAAQQRGLIQPLLVGNLAKLYPLIEQTGLSITEKDLFPAADDIEACRMAVNLVRQGKASVLMKGATDTKNLLAAVVDRDSGLRKSDTLSHVAVFELHGRLVAVADGGMVPYPTLEQKKVIIENTVSVLRALGISCPRVGVLTCVEKVNPKMPETQDAERLQQMNREGLIADCIVAGPISYDCAMDADIAAIKKYESPVAGQADALIVPNIHAGNILGKALTVSAGARMAGIVVGAACPVVLASRGATAEEKLLSILLAAVVSHAS